jgi:hypothetical protein
MTVSRSQLAWAMAGVLFLGGAAIRVLAQKSGPADQAQDEKNRASGYEVLAKGIVGSRPFQVQFKSSPLRLEIRNWVMGRGETEPIPTPTRVLLEVRQGAVTTSINQEKQNHSQGDFWVVDKGSSFTVQNSGEVAVLRAIYIFEGSR